MRSTTDARIQKLDFTLHQIQDFSREATNYLKTKDFDEELTQYVTAAPIYLLLAGLMDVIDKSASAHEHSHFDKLHQTIAANALEWIKEDGPLLKKLNDSIYNIRSLLEVLPKTSAEMTTFLRPYLPFISEIRYTCLGERAAKWAQAEKNLISSPAFKLVNHFELLRLQLQQFSQPHELVFYRNFFTTRTLVPLLKEVLDPGVFTMFSIWFKFEEALSQHSPTPNVESLINACDATNSSILSESEINQANGIHTINGQFLFFLNVIFENQQCLPLYTQSYPEHANLIDFLLKQGIAPLADGQILHADGTVYAADGSLISGKNSAMAIYYHTLRLDMTSDSKPDTSFVGKVTSAALPRTDKSVQAYNTRAAITAHFTTPRSSDELNRSLATHLAPRQKRPSASSSSSSAAAGSSNGGASPKRARREQGRSAVLPSSVSNIAEAKQQLTSAAAGVGSNTNKRKSSSQAETKNEGHEPQGETARLKEQLAELKEQHAQLKEKYAGVKVKNARLVEKNDRFADENAKLTRKIAKRDDTIARREGKIAGRDDTIARLSHNNIALVAMLTSLPSPQQLLPLPQPPLASAPSQQSSQVGLQPHPHFWAMLNAQQQQQQPPTPETPQAQLAATANHLAGTRSPAGIFASPLLQTPSAPASDTDHPMNGPSLTGGSTST